MNLSAHFTLHELTFSDTAHRLGINNTPNTKIVENLTGLAMTMEKVRDLLGFPIRVNSGYRCAKLNAAVGGSKHSAHLEGLACDFTCAEFGAPYDICKAIEASDIDYHQLIHEYGQWVHLGLRPAHLAWRRESLSILKSGRHKGIVRV